MLSRQAWIPLLLSAALSFAQSPAGSALNDDLFAATRKGDVEQVKSLLAKGADVNAKNRYGSTPLFFACDRGNLEMVRLLIDKGANPDVKDTFYNMSPISWAVSKKKTDLLV